VYAPCAGPILAGVITVSASQSFTAGRVAVALSYGVGSALVLYALMLGGRRLTGRLARRSGRLQMSMGAIMIVVALAMLGNYDTRFETAIASDLPSFLVDPTRGLETSHAATAQLAALRGHGSRHSGGLRQADAGARLPDLGPAPALAGTQMWFNTPGGRPLTLVALHGHVVLVDFWTYSCINCIRTLPYLNAWYAKYRRDGFVIIGVHTPEFPFEHSAANVAQAIAQNGIRYPVVQDNNYATWNAYNNQFWPAEYLIDPHGRIRLADFGEGDYGAKERAIRSLIAQAGAGGLGSPSTVHAQQPSDGNITPESYLGAARAARFANGQITPGVYDFGSAEGPLAPDQLRYGGAWRISGSSATALAGARIRLNFNARRVFLVMGSPARPRNVAVRLDGRPIPQPLAGSDAHRSLARVSFQRLYRLVDLPRVERHVLTIEPAAGVIAYSFTFG
jgi:thiol-disulfide isomerase/thioredoxin